MDEDQAASRPEHAANASAPPPPLITEDLERKVRRLRTWLIVVSSVLALVLLSVCGSIGVTWFGVMSISRMGGVTDEQVEQTREEFRDALGDKGRDLVVRKVEMTYEGGAPFPFSLMSGPRENAIYIEYRLKGHDVLFANVSQSMMYGGPDQGLLPLKGSLESRMEERQLERLVEAYAEESDEPIGGVRRYSDVGEMMGGPSSGPETIKSGDKEYDTKTLWVAVEGVRVKGDKVDMSALVQGSREALVFYEDPKSGQFSFIGTEPAANWAMY